MRPLLVPAILLFASGCASAGASAAGGAPMQTVATNRVMTSGGEMMQTNTMNIDTDVKLFVTGTVDEAWAVLPGVYQALGIPLSMNDNVRKTLGNSGWRVRRQIGRVSTRNYLDCGSSGTLENAETYQLTLSISTTVLPNAKGGSIISTALTGSGKNPVTSSSAEVRCASKGDLEMRIRDEVQKALLAR
jgi:hypothetical protein